MKAPLSPAVQVQVWMIQAMLADDQPRTYAEIEQTIGADPQPAMEALLDNGKVDAVTIEGYTFWRRRFRT